MKRYDEAITHLQRALQLDPSYEAARLNLTRAMARDGR
jgi:tetratricopeptide (TPR) repeat protein